MKRYRFLTIVLASIPFIGSCAYKTCQATDSITSKIILTAILFFILKMIVEIPLSLFHRDSWDAHGIANAISVIVALSTSLYFFYGRGYFAYKPFQHDIGQFVNVPGLKENLKATYIVGKILPVNKVTGTIDPLYFCIPKDLRADLPEDVGTIVWLNCTKESVGIYETGTVAYQSKCEVTVIDRVTSSIVGRSTFSGAPPPSRKFIGTAGNWHSDRPLDEIVQYIVKQPRVHSSSADVPSKASAQAPT